MSAEPSPESLQFEDSCVCSVMGVRRGGITDISPPLEIGSKSKKILENLKLAAKFRKIHLIVAMTVYLPV